MTAVSQTNNGRIYSKRTISRMISNTPLSQAMFDLRVVPKELATVVEVELDDGFVLAKSENIISVDHRFGEAYLIRKINEQRPDIICAADSTLIDEVQLGDIINNVNNPFVPPIRENDLCYCTPCDD